MKFGWSPTIDDGYIRTFRQKDIPGLNSEELTVLKAWFEEGKLEEMAIYFTEVLDISNEITDFLLREFLRGYL